VRVIEHDLVGWGGIRTPMKHEMKHDLSPELAKRVAEKAFESYSQKYAKYDPTINWTSEVRAEACFSVKGVSLKGVIELEPNSISFDLKVPFMLRMFKGKAIDIMDRELRFWTDKAKAGDIS
jgi:hypothetical protein